MQNHEKSTNEFKWKKDTAKTPKEFLKNYADSQFQVVSKENYWKFLIGESEEETKMRLQYQNWGK